MFTSSLAIGFVETSSISRGLYLTDLVLKKAPVRVIASQPISSGKHVLLFVGDVASVEESHRTAVDSAENTLLKQILIPGIHEALTPFLTLTNPPGHSPQGEDSLGIVESQTLAGAILAADQALKTADVSLLRLRLGQGIGGKAYFVMSGRQEEVEASLEAAEACLNQMDSFIRTDLIARPLGEALEYF